MKLANEIAEEIYREQKTIRDRFGVELGVETVKGIIAARLEPVKDALAGMLGEYENEDPSSGGFLDLLTTGEDIMQCKAALTTLSEVNDD